MRVCPVVVEAREYLRSHPSIKRYTEGSLIQRLVETIEQDKNREEVKPITTLNVERLEERIM